MRAAASMHVELVNTDIDDFAEHMVEQIKALASVLHPSVAKMQWDVVQIPGGTTSRGSLKDDDLKSNIAFQKIGMTCCLWLVDIKRPTSHMPAAKFMFALSARRYRRDRLDVAVYEDVDTQPLVGDTLMKWLKLRWRDGLLPLDPALAPPLSGNDPMPILPEQAKEADYFDFFDWCYRQPGSKNWTIQDMANMQKKSSSRMEKMHAAYRAELRNRDQS